MRAMISTIRNAACAILLIAIAGPDSLAQSIKGKVFDPDGGVIPKTRVMLMQDYVKQQETTTDEKGTFEFTGLAQGRYQVQIKQTMFSLFQQTVDLKGAEPAMVYAVLPLGRMSDGIQINGQLALSVQRNPALDVKVVRTGGKIEPASLMEFPRPEYPPGPDARGVEGTVVLFATIKEDGSVADPVVLSSPDVDFDAACKAAVKKWRYRPMKLNGHPVETQVTITLQFNLK
jgi:TonB family protein